MRAIQLLRGKLTQLVDYIIKLEFHTVSIPRRASTQSIIVSYFNSLITLGLNRTFSSIHYDDVKFGDLILVTRIFVRILHIY